MDSQGENFIHNLSHIADFRLKCCILKEDTKNNISGRSPLFSKSCQSQGHFDSSTYKGAGSLAKTD